MEAANRLGTDLFICVNYANWWEFLWQCGFWLEVKDGEDVKYLKTQSVRSKECSMEEVSSLLLRGLPLLKCPDVCSQHVGGRSVKGSQPTDRGSCWRECTTPNNIPDKCPAFWPFHLDMVEGSANTSLRVLCEIADFIDLCVLTFTLLTVKLTEYVWRLNTSGVIRSTTLLETGGNVSDGSGEHRPALQKTGVIQS